MSDFRPGTATPQGVAQFNDEGVSKDGALPRGTS